MRLIMKMFLFMATASTLSCSKNSDLSKSSESNFSINQKDCPDLNGTFQISELTNNKPLNLNMSPKNGKLELVDSSTGTWIVDGTLKSPNSDSGISPFVEKYRAFCKSQSLIIEIFVEDGESKSLTTVYRRDKKSNQLSIQMDSGEVNNPLFNNTYLWTRTGP